jgi:hypothetical protein
MSKNNLYFPFFKWFIQLFSFSKSGNYMVPKFFINSSSYTCVSPLVMIYSEKDLALQLSKPLIFINYIYFCYVKRHILNYN